MNVKILAEVITHSTAFKYWLLLIPFKTTGGWATVGLIKAYLGKQARKVDTYITNATGYGMSKLGCTRPDRIIHLTYYIMEAGNLTQ